MPISVHVQTPSTRDSTRASSGESGSARRSSPCTARGESSYCVDFNFQTSERHAFRRFVSDPEKVA